MRFPSRSHKLATLLASVVALLALPWASAQSVQFQLRNGDRVTGEIQSETADGLTLKTPWGGTVGVPAKEIVSGRMIIATATNSVSSAVLNPVANVSPPAPLRAKSHKWLGEIQAGLDVLFS